MAEASKIHEWINVSRRVGSEAVIPLFPEDCDYLEDNVNSSLVNGHANSENGATYLPWPDYFMSLCHLTAARSKDPYRKVGACIVDKENRVLSVGYNGMPRGIRDDQLPWEREAEHLHETKYPYVCHAEMNAIINERRSDFEGCCLYVTKFPCYECAKLIIQAGIKRVVFSERKALSVEKLENQLPARRMFNHAGIVCKKFVPSIRHLSINIGDEDAKVTFN